MRRIIITLAKNDDRAYEALKQHFLAKASDAQFELRLNEDIIGGFIAIDGNTVIDYSISGRLADMRKHLME